jgi:histidinol-phosphate aminotransferase
MRLDGRCTSTEEVNSVNQAADFVLSARAAALPELSPPVLVEANGRLARGIRRLNLNESPTPPSPSAVAAMQAAAQEVAAYPDHGCSALRTRLSEATGVQPARILFGNGSGELLIASAAVALNPGDEAVVPAPTFPAITKGIALAGGRQIAVPVGPEGVVDGEALLAAVTPRTRLVYTCTPNNPTGGAMSAEALRRLARGTPRDILLVVDEAYFEFAQACDAANALEALAEREGPWVVTRTFSKAYALAGMRVGYAFTGDDAVAKALDGLRGSFNLSRVAIAGAAAAFDDEPYMRALVQATIDERARLASGLAQLGFKTFPTCANFVTATTQVPASALAARLAAAGILVQALGWPAPAGSCRISVGNADDTDAVLAAFERALDTLLTRHSRPL